MVSPRHSDSRRCGSTASQCRAAFGRAHRHRTTLTLQRGRHRSLTVAHHCQTPGPSAPSTCVRARWRRRSQRWRALGRCSLRTLLRRTGSWTGETARLERVMCLRVKSYAECRSPDPSDIVYERLQRELQVVCGAESSEPVSRHAPRSTEDPRLLLRRALRLATPRRLRRRRIGVSAAWWQRTDAAARHVRAAARRSGDPEG